LRTDLLISAVQLRCRTGGRAACGPIGGWCVPEAGKQVVSRGVVWFSVLIVVATE